jgi:trans-aconitate methyltransferase
VNQFDQAGYWQERHIRLVGDPRSVGNVGKSLDENLESEHRLRLVVSRAAELLKPGRTVLDLGCGYGRAADCFTSHDYGYVGVDVSPHATAQAQSRNPAATFITADLATWDTGQRFDVVCALYVFVHFVDDAAWASIVNRAMRWVAPSGGLLMADHLPTDREQPSQHVVARPLSEYAAPASEHGLYLDEGFKALLTGEGPRRLDNAKHFNLFRKPL